MVMNQHYLFSWLRRTIRNKDCSVILRITFKESLVDPNTCCFRHEDVFIGINYVTEVSRFCISMDEGQRTLLYNCSAVLSIALEFNDKNSRFIIQLWEVKYMCKLLVLGDISKALSPLCTRDHTCKINTSVKWNQFLFEVCFCIEFKYLQSYFWYILYLHYEVHCFIQLELFLVLVFEWDYH